MSNDTSNGTTSDPDEASAASFVSPVRVNVQPGRAAVILLAVEKQDATPVPLAHPGDLLGAEET